jgi:chorismate dehydratase
MFADGADAAVVIGDEALSASLIGASARGWYVTDLADEWRAWTGLPMVFAVWAGRREVVDHPRDQVDRLRMECMRALALAAQRPDEVAAHAADGTAFTTTQLTRY